MPQSVQIVPFFTQPHVHTVINDNSYYEEGTAAKGNQEAKPYNTMLVFGADKGIDNKFVKLTDYGTKVEIFGKGNYRKYGQPSIQADVLLQTNQANVWAMRVLPLKPDGGPGSAQYANLAVIAHYRVPKCAQPGWVPGDGPDPTDCEINELGGSPENPVLTPTGLKQLEVKYSVINVSSKLAGASNPVYDRDIENYLVGKNGDPTSSKYGQYNLPRGTNLSNEEAAIYDRTREDLLGWFSVPLFYVRSVGRGRYGNNYALRLERNSEFEYDHDLKSYGFGLVERSARTNVKNYSVGSMVTTLKYEKSMLIDDVVSQFPEGSYPIVIKTYQDSFQEIFNAYRSVVSYNRGVISSEYSRDVVKLMDFEYAVSLLGDLDANSNNYDNLDIFDPIFGYRLNDRENLMPYYANFTATGEPYVEPDVTFMNNRPTKVTPGDGYAWDKFVDTDGSTMIRRVGDRVLVKHYLNDGPASEPSSSGGADMDRLFTVIDLDVKRVTPDGDVTEINVTYDEGSWVPWNAREFTGTNLQANVGIPLAGGYDGEFEEIIAYPRRNDGLGWQVIRGSEITRPPSDSELKLLLAREYVSALRGEKDKYILSPARIDIDVIFDANYNICADMEVKIVNHHAKVRALWGNANVLTDDEYRQLSLLDTGYDFNIGNVPVADALNVKKALWDLNNYRNRNGMPNLKLEGAGCELKLDCGLIGLRSTAEVNTELKDLLKVMIPFDGRNTSVDFGWYEIIDPVTKRKIPVSVGYFLAERLLPHIAQFGPNKPFTNNFAQITTIVKNSFRPELDLIDWDVKELLYDNRINYYLTLDEGAIVQRFTQSTCQRDASALLEENNVRVLNILKKGLEKACRSFMYEWNEPTVRKGYTDAQMEIYRPWIGTWVQDLQIRFEANEYEQDRMIMHCYVDVKFRDIIKRITIEIDISKPNRGGGA